MVVCGEGEVYTSAPPPLLPYHLLSHFNSPLGHHSPFYPPPLPISLLWSIHTDSNLHMCIPNSLSLPLPILSSHTTPTLPLFQVPPHILLEIINAYKCSPTKQETIQPYIHILTVMVLGAGTTLHLCQQGPSVCWY